MESASDNQQQEPSVRPKRSRHLPQHLAQYDVDLPLSQQPEAQDSSNPVGQQGQVQSTEARSSMSYPSSASSRRSSRSSRRLSLFKSTSDIQAAGLEEQIKGLELTDLKQEIEEERKADLIPSSTESREQSLLPPSNDITSIQTNVSATVAYTSALSSALLPTVITSVSNSAPVQPTFGHVSTSAHTARIEQTTKSVMTNFPSQSLGVLSPSLDNTTPSQAERAALPPHAVQHTYPNEPAETPVPAAPWIYPGIETLIANSHGIPKLTLPPFESGKESDFALLKMGLDNSMNNHPYLSEHYKYQVLLSQLKLPSALQLAKSYMYDPTPYTTALGALQDKYGQPRQLVQSELSAILNSPAIKSGDAKGFDSLALSVQSLVGMLQTLEGPIGYELRCGSHVDVFLANCLLPTEMDLWTIVLFVAFCNQVLSSLTPCQILLHGSR